MISQEEFRKLILENKWDKISELSDEEIIELVSYGEDEDAISAEDAVAIINKARANQEVTTKILILKNEEVDELQNIIHWYEKIVQPDKDLVEQQKLIDKINNS